MAELLGIMDQIREGPTTVVRDGTYGEVIALLKGFDIAKDYSPLEGFQEWLVVRANKANNFTWDGLALLVLDVKLDRFAEGKFAEHHDVIRSLIDLIKEFLADRDKRGIETIMDDHQRWLESQEWYEKTD